MFLAIVLNTFGATLYVLSLIVLVVQQPTSQLLPTGQGCSRQQLTGQLLFLPISVKIMLLYVEALFLHYSVIHYSVKIMLAL